VKRPTREQLVVLGILSVRREGGRDWSRDALRATGLDCDKALDKLVGVGLVSRFVGDDYRLTAARDGRVRNRLHRYQAPYFCDYFMEAECDVYGIGRGTLSSLQGQGYLQKSEDEGPLGLTPLGDQVLDEILALGGTTAPLLVGAA
jgi:hypothetical protein